MQAVTVSHNGKEVRIENVVSATLTYARRSNPAKAVIEYIENGRPSKMTVSGDVSILYHGEAT